MTNTELFEQYKILIAGLFVARMKEQEDTEELVAIIVDPAAEMPDALRDALEIEAADDPETQAKIMPLPGEATMAQNLPTYRMGTLYREPLREALLIDHAEVAMALDQPTKLNRVPCIVLAGGSLTLHRLAIQALRWVAGGNA